jgi:hypothetical protein
MALPYPNPDPRTSEWDAFALKRNLEYLDQKLTGSAHDTLSLEVGSVTTSGTSETTLFSYSILGNQLAVNGQRLELYVSGTTTAGGATKQLRLYFGGTLLLNDATSASGADWIINARIIRLSGASQLCVVWDTVDAAVNNAQTATTTHDMTTALDLAVTGETSIAAQPVTGLSYELIWLPP